MKYKVEVKSLMHLEVERGDTTSRLNAVDVDFDVIIENGQSTRARYLLPDGLPDRNGIKTITLGLVSGLKSNIEAGHQSGLWDSAEHLRYIISELERQFVQVAQSVPSEYGKEKE